MQALGEACCLQPMPYHFHQQQVKVLVHNPILPAFHHPFTSPMGPSIIEIPRETKPSALISPQRLPQIGPGTGDDNSQSQQQEQPVQVQSQQGLHSPQQPPQTGEKEPKGNFPPQEMPDNKTDIKEPVTAPKRCHNGNGDQSIVCKTESDKKNSSEPSVKSVTLSKENIKAANPGVSTVRDGKVAVESEANLSGKNSNNGSHNSDSDKEKSQTDNKKKKKSKDGERAKKGKHGEKSKEKKKKKKEKPLEGGEKDEKSVKKKKKKKKGWCCC